MGGGVSLPPCHTRQQVPEFRMVTMYGGDGSSAPDLYAADVIAVGGCKDWKSGVE